jgi:HD-GYP domain-containing protein (c-di-GMP phosphodiesterase class II)
MSALDQPLFQHRDILQDLNYSIPLAHKLTVVHAVIKTEFSFVDRIAVAVYDHKTDMLKTYVHSTPQDESPLNHYQAKLSEASSLADIVKQKQPRVVNNLALFAQGKNEHTQRINAHGFASSYTVPMYHNDAFYGFVFFNSYQNDVFAEELLPQLDVYSHLISLLIINDQNSIHTLLSSVKAAQSITHFRDIETGNHIERMSRYARLIAVHLADEYELDDEYIEHVYMFAALHDIGKIAIPDSILHKPGKLDPEERRVMNTHPSKGREIIDCILDDYGLKAFDHTEILRNIAQFHHEAVNGSGYPAGLQGEDIPLEARIIAVADVFDALVSKRPYKEAWSNEQAIATLQELANSRLDAACVTALIQNREQVEHIQGQFVDEALK